MPEWDGWTGGWVGVGLWERKATDREVRREMKRVSSGGEREEEKRRPSCLGVARRDLIRQYSLY